MSVQDIPFTRDMARRADRCQAQDSKRRPRAPVAYAADPGVMKPDASRQCLTCHACPMIAGTCSGVATVSENPHSRPACWRDPETGQRPGVILFDVDRDGPFIPTQGELFPQTQADGEAA